MELPFNTVFSQGIARATQVEPPVADWPTKRAWVEYAFNELRGRLFGFERLHDGARCGKVNFVIATTCGGARHVSTGVASFGHVSGVHYQNLPDWDGYLGR